VGYPHYEQKKIFEALNENDSYSIRILSLGYAGREVFDMAGEEKDGDYVKC